MPIAYESVNSAGTGIAGTAITVSAPSGIEDDDILILAGSLGYNIGVGFSSVSCPGFTNIANYTDGGSQLIGGGALWKRASSESGGYVLTFNGADSTVDRTAVIIRISGARATGSPIEAHAVSSRVSGGGSTLDGVHPDITVTRQCLIVRLSIWEGGYSSISTARISGVAVTERADRSLTYNNTTISTDNALVDSDPGTMTARMTQSDATTCGGWLSTIAIQELIPAVATGPKGCDFSYRWGW